VIEPKEKETVLKPWVCGILRQLLGMQFDTVLSIGVRRKSDAWLKLFKNIEFLEIYKPNVDRLRSVGATVYHGDVRVFVPEKKYDVVIWTNGPEHIELDRLYDTLRLVESYSRFFILSCPWGEHKQGASYGNQNECHVSTLYKRNFADFNVQTYGEQHKKGKIVAWKSLV
jgi:hypothetical protein